MSQVGGVSTLALSVEVIKYRVPHFPRSLPFCACLFSLQWAGSALRRCAQIVICRGRTLPGSLPLLSLFLIIWEESGSLQGGIQGAWGVWLPLFGLLWYSQNMEVWRAPPCLPWVLFAAACGKCAHQLNFWLTKKNLRAQPTLNKINLFESFYKCWMSILCFRCDRKKLTLFFSLFFFFLELVGQKLSCCCSHLVSFNFKLLRMGIFCVYCQTYSMSIGSSSLPSGARWFGKESLFLSLWRDTVSTVDVHFVWLEVELRDPSQ